MRTRGQIKELAKFQFRQRYGMSVGAALLLILLGGGQSAGPNFNFTYNSSSIKDLHLDRIPYVGAIASWIIGVVVALAMIVWVVHMLVGLPMEVGHAHFSRCIYNNWITSVGDMFRRGFGDYGRHLGGLLWRDLFIFLWSLLLVIPGIVKSYAYFAAPYLLAEFPAVTRDGCHQNIDAHYRWLQGRDIRIGLELYRLESAVCTDAGAAGNIVR